MIRSAARAAARAARAGRAPDHGGACRSPGGAGRARRRPGPGCPGRAGGAIAAPGGRQRISIRAPALPSASLARATVARAAGAQR